MKIVSACLAGVKCRYDGKANYSLYVIELVKKGEAIPVCPEQLGGLATPRPPVEQRNGRCYTDTGVDVTDSFKKGAEEAVYIAKLAGCNEAILKAKSPSCGCGKVYDGTFSKNLIDGDGVFAALLKREGIIVKTEKDV